VGSAAAGGSAGSDFRFFGGIGKRARVLRPSLGRWRLGFPDTGGSERGREHGGRKWSKYVRPLIGRRLKKPMNTWAKLCNLHGGP
jgi:hypothetical protein